jgi:hypothetical protein
MPRLEKYRPPNGSDLEMVVNYFWNVMLSEALYPGLAALEVTLRNSIHNALTAREGTDMWFRYLLLPRQLREFANTAATLDDRHRRDKLPPPTTDQLIAELTFGFWTTLLSQPYHQSLWAPNHADLVHAVFPQLRPTPNVRPFLQHHYNPLSVLRNRVMHHEPVFQRLQWEKRVIPINDLHRDILTAIGWISPSVLATVTTLDAFPQVFHSGRATIERDIKQQLGIP